MNADAFLAGYDTIDAKLVAKGFPATSPWWRATIDRIIRSGRRTAVLRVGRRGGKSSTLCRVAVALAMFGGMSVPPGDVLTFAFVSVSRDEAASRLRTIGAILDALGLTYRPAREGHGHELDARPIVFRVFTASIAGVSGPTCGAVFCDEVAKWRDADTGANPATEVLASVRPTLATTKGFLFMSSSPLSTIDAHAESFERGDTETQIVAHAPTWTANPTITEADTHALESDPRVWAREYAAIPMGAVSAAFDGDDIEAAYRPLDVAWNYHQPIVAIDASSGRGDAFVGAVLGWIVPILPADAWESEPLRDHRGTVVGAPSLTLDEQGRPVLRPEYIGRDRPMLRVHSLGAIVGKWGRLTLDQIVEAIARRAHMFGARLVVGDQHLAAALEPAFRSHRLRYESIAWTNASKNEAVERLRWLLRDRAVDLSEGGETLKRELLQFSERVTASGAITYAARGSAHDDHVAAVLTGCMADLDGLMKGSLGGGSYRRIHHLEERQR